MPRYNAPPKGTPTGPQAQRRPRQVSSAQQQHSVSGAEQERTASAPGHDSMAPTPSSARQLPRQNRKALDNFVMQGEATTADSTTGGSGSGKGK
ncbi:hypothetical protein V5O48_017318, partial [Marasmius crinis-equi]